MCAMATAERCRPNWPLIGVFLALVLLLALVTGTVFAVGAPAAGLVVHPFLVVRGRHLATPAISGPIVVWQQYRRMGPVSRGDIYGKNLATGGVFRVTAGGTVLSGPAISGSTVAWSDCRACTITRGAMGYITYHNVRVYARDLSSGKTMLVVTLRSAPPQTPAVAGHVVLWYEERNGRMTTYGKDLVSGHSVAITSASRCRQPARPRGHIVVVWVTTTPAGPRLCGLAAVADRVFLIPVARRPLTAPRDARVGDDFVIWTNWDANRARQPAAIEGQDLARRRPFHVTTIPYGRFNPQLGPATAVSSDLVVWQAAPSAPYTGENAPIYGYHVPTGRTVRITSTPTLPESMTVSGDTVVWADVHLGSSGIYGARVTAS